MGGGARTQSSSIAIAIPQAPAWHSLQSQCLLGQQAPLVVHVLVCSGVGQIIIGCSDHLRQSVRCVEQVLVSSPIRKAKRLKSVSYIVATKNIGFEPGIRSLGTNTTTGAGREGIESDRSNRSRGISCN